MSETRDRARGRGGNDATAAWSHRNGRRRNQTAACPTGWTASDATRSEAGRSPKKQESGGSRIRPGPAHPLLSALLGDVYVRIERARDTISRGELDRAGGLLSDLLLDLAGHVDAERLQRRRPRRAKNGPRTLPVAARRFRDRLRQGSLTRGQDDASCDTRRIHDDRTAMR